MGDAGRLSATETAQNTSAGGQDANGVTEPDQQPLVLVAESDDGNLWFNPATGSCVVPAHWLAPKEIHS